MAQTTVAINLEAKTKGTESVKSLKAQIKEATNEAILLAQKFGDFSPEAIAAAEKVAKLKDEMGDFNQRVQALNPDKFAAIGTVVTGLAGGIQAAQGAMALFGAESEDTQKAMLKVQGAMAFAQGVDQLMQMKDTFGAMASFIKTKVVTAFHTLRGAIISTGLGALAVALGMIIANFNEIYEWIMKSPFGVLAKTIEKAITALTDFLGLTSQAERDLDKFAKLNEKSNDELSRQIDVLTALGGKEKEIYELKKRQAENELNVLRKTLKVKGKLTEDELKQFHDLKNQQKVLTIEYNNFVESEADKKKKEDDADAAADAAKARENYKKNVENQRKALQDLAEEKRKQDELNAKDERALADIKYKNDLERLEVAKKSELAQENLTAKAKQAIQDRYAVLAVNVKTEHDKKIAELDQKAKDNLKKQEEDLGKWTEEQNDKEIAALNQYYKKKELAAIQNNATPEQLAALELARMEEEKRLLLEHGKSITDIELQILAKKKEIYDKDVQAKNKAEEDKKKAQDDTLQNIKSGLDTVMQLTDAFAGKSEESQKRAFEIRKAASIAQAIVETYSAAQSAYASQIIPLDPTSVIRAQIAAGIAIAGGLARVAAISKTKFQSKGAPGAPNAGGGGGGTPAAPALTPIVGGALPDEQQFGGMGRVYVLEGDITKTQTRVRRLRNTSVV